jgi:hypothetical protein
MLGFGFKVEPVLARRRQRRSSYLQQDDGMFSVCLSVCLGFSSVDADNTGLTTHSRSLVR